MKVSFAFIVTSLFLLQANASTVQEIANVNVGEKSGKIEISNGVCGLWVQQDAYGQQGYNFGFYRRTASGRVRHESMFVDYDSTEPQWTIQDGQLSYDDRSNDQSEFELYVIFHFDQNTKAIASFELPNENTSCVLNNSH